jgi:hypothetical protein
VSTSLVRRALGDLTGCAMLAILLALIVYGVPGLGTLAQRGNVFLPSYLGLVVGGYVCWLKMEKKLREPRWLLQAVGSVCVGAVFFIPDVLIGVYRNPSLPVLAAAASTGMMFGVTLLACPGYALIAFSGWARSLVIGDGSRIRQLS